MRFLSGLGKGFVRSAVNQVGRDTGRQVSGAIFNSAQSSTGETVSISELKPVVEYVPLKILLALFLSWIVPVFGGICYIYFGIHYIFIEKFRKYYRIEKLEVYAADRRFKTGKRFEGHRDVKVIYKGPVDDVKRKSNVIKGVFYLFIGITSAVYYSYYLYRYFNK